MSADRSTDEASVPLDDDEPDDFVWHRILHPVGNEAIDKAYAMRTEITALCGRVFVPKAVETPSNVTNAPTSEAVLCEACELLLSGWGDRWADL